MFIPLHKQCSHCASLATLLVFARDADRSEQVCAAHLPLAIKNLTDTDDTRLEIEALFSEEN